MSTIAMAFTARNLLIDEIPTKVQIVSPIPLASRQVAQEEAKALMDKHSDIIFDFIETSALTGTNVEEALSKVAHNAMRECSKPFPKCAQDLWGCIMMDENANKYNNNNNKGDVVFSSYDDHRFFTLHRTFFFPTGVKTMATTVTTKGITTKQILVGLTNDQLWALDKRWASARRPVGAPSQADLEEGLPAYNPVLPISPKHIISYFNTVCNADKIHTVVLIDDTPSTSPPQVSSCCCCCCSY
eukprot:GEZU01026609.1.p1 GENE.GEZU01026609.1~~GEZU01026609.1.p1  ORF type:complete len:243 (-),score=43.97 GEZU01026609.1:728-1456(-)